MFQKQRIIMMSGIEKIGGINWKWGKMLSGSIKSWYNDKANITVYNAGNELTISISIDKNC